MKKYIMISIILLTAGFLAAQSYPFFPKTNVFESCYSTAVNTPDYIQGLNTITQTYDDDEALVLRYFSTSGDYGTADTQTMITNLGGTDYPSVFFNGNKIVKGFRPEFDNANLFQALIRKHHTNPAPVFIDDISLNTQNGTLTCKVIDAIDQSSLQNKMIQYLIIENNVSGYNGVVRAIQTENISIANDGGNTTKTKTFSLNPAWVTGNLQAVVIVRDQNYQILNAMSSANYPTYKLRYVAPGERGAFGVFNNPAEFEYIALVNMDYDMDYIINYRISFNPVDAPDSWSIGYCDSTQCYFGESNQSMPAGTIDWYKPEGFPYESGSGTLRFDVNANTLPMINCDYQLVTDDIQILVIDDDGIQNRQSIYRTDLPFTQKLYGIIDPTIWDMELIDFNDFDITIWSAQSSYSLMPSDNLPDLQSAVESGKYLIMTGQSIGWMLSSDNSVYKNENTLSFYHNVLNADNFTSEAYTSVVGTNSPIGHGLNLSLLTGDNEFAQNTPERILFTAGEGKTALFKAGSSNDITGLSSQLGFGNIVFLSYGLEGVTDPILRRAIINRSLNWFGIPSANDDSIIIPQALKAGIYPNPVRSSAEIKISSNDNQTKSIEIFNVKGQKINQIVSDNKSDHQTIRWNGKDSKGNAVANGIYFFKIQSGQQTLTKKAIVVK